MVDIPFSVGGTQMPCPKFTPEPGGLAFSYQDGSQLYLGAPSMTCDWSYLRDDYVEALWGTYNTAVNSTGAELLTDTSIAVTVPDYVNGGLRLVKVYMTRPTGKAVGDGTQNMRVIFTAMHATSMITAYNAPETNYCNQINNGDTVVVGVNGYENTDWQF